MKFSEILLSAIGMLCPLLASAELFIAVAPVKVTGQKAIVPLAMQNGFSEKIESARAVVFLLDEKGKMVGQTTKWVIGGSRDKPGLESGATNAFHFVITNDKPFTSTNLTAKVTFSRIVMEGGKLADLNHVILNGQKSEKK
jgi:hypothetical protein